MALHNTETPTLPKIASTDIVLASTLLLTLGPKKGKTNLIGLLMRVHFHRLIVDEAHDNELGQGNKKALSVLSATHRLSVTGAPLGSRLSDLYGQVRFLRVAPFDRPAFWSELIEEPYAAKDAATLGVLRLLLSHIVVRHSKEQTHDDGRCLVALPPRRIEQILLDFGSDEEQQLYALIESRNRTYWTEIAAAEKKRRSIPSTSSVRSCCWTPVESVRTRPSWTCPRCSTGGSARKRKPNVLATPKGQRQHEQWRAR